MIFSVISSVPPVGHRDPTLRNDADLLRFLPAVEMTNI